MEAIARRKGITLEEAKAIRQDITEKWSESLKASGLYGGFSKISQELFETIQQTHPSIRFGKNERRIRLPSQVANVDCFHPETNRIVEFHGDYWHANPKMYTENQIIKKSGRPGKTGNDLIAKDIWEKDSRRLTELEEKGYEVLVVWESEYKADKEAIIQKIRDFLDKK